MQERRRHARLVAKGTVVARSDLEVVHARIANISEGGVAVVLARTPHGADVGAVLELELRLDDARGEWMHTTGRVLRVQPDRLAFAFATSPPTALVRALGELADASHVRRRTLSVVLVDSDSARRSALAAAFGSVGCVVVEAASPLEAVVRLGECSFEPDVIAIADSYPAEAADDVRGFVRHNHPRAGLVTIGHDRPALEAIASWISSADVDANLEQNIRNVLSHVLLS